MSAPSLSLLTFALSRTLHSAKLPPLANPLQLQQLEVVEEVPDHPSILSSRPTLQETSPASNNNSILYIVPNSPCRNT